MRIFILKIEDGNDQHFYKLIDYNIKMSWMKEITGLAKRAFEDYSFKSPDLEDYLKNAPSYIDINHRGNLLNLRNRFFHMNFYQNSYHFDLYFSKLKPTIIFGGSINNQGVENLICNSIIIHIGNLFGFSFSDDGSIIDHLEIKMNSYPPAKEKWFEEANLFLRNFAKKYKLEEIIRVS